VSELHGRYATYAAALRDGVLGPAGQTPADLRRAVVARAARLGGGADRMDAPAVPETLAGYVDTVARHAYKVTDEDLAGLLRAGNSEDALFEVTVAAALGAALGRLERGLAALRGPLR